MKDLVSVIIPTFNRAYIVRNAIESVLAQTHASWELLVVDDGSTDDTEDVVKSFSEPRIRYFRQDNRGQAAARNVGLKEAQGAWVAFLDSDNELLPMHLETTLKHFREDSKILCILPKGNRTLERYENGVLVESKTVDSFPADEISNPAKAVFLRDFIFDPTGFIHSIKIRDEGIRFDEAMRYMEDWDYVMTIAEAHPDAFLYIPIRLYNYHQRYGGDGLVSNTSYAAHADVYEYIFQKHKNDKLMEGQTWYPAKMLKWRERDKEFKAGLLPGPDMYQFWKPH